MTDGRAVALGGPAAGVARVDRRQRRAARRAQPRAAGGLRAVAERLRRPGRPQRGRRLHGCAPATWPRRWRGSAAASPTTYAGWPGATCVAREECADDGRGAWVVLTPTGRDAIAQAAPGHARLVRGLVFDDLDDADLAVLDRVLGLD